MATNMGMADGRHCTLYYGPRTLQHMLNTSLNVDNEGFRKKAYEQGKSILPPCSDNSPKPWLTNTIASNQIPILNSNKSITGMSLDALEPRSIVMPQ